jgi:type II pantothenate kinase
LIRFDLHLQLVCLSALSRRLAEELKDKKKRTRQKATMTPFVATDEPVAAAPPNHHHQQQRQRNQEHRDDADDEPPRRAAKRSRTMTSTEEIDSTITRPGSVKINVQGAFIVDPDAATPAQNGSDNGRVSPSHHETSDIRLPNHTAIVSHIAVDVSRSLCILQ